MENAYSYLEQVRRGVNEYHANYMPGGSDTTGAFSTAEIMKYINDAQRFYYNLLLARDAHRFYKSTSLTPGSSSAYTWPGDFSKVRRIENSDGNKIIKIDLDQKRLTEESGIGLFYYPYGLTGFTLDKLSSSETLTLHYIFRPRDLDCGVAAAGGALSITLATTARKTVDFYNSMKIADITKDWEDTITDYATTRVATIAQTAATSDVYGLISELPEDLHHLVPLKAIQLMKSGYKNLKPPTPKEVLDLKELQGMAFSALLGTFESDEDWGEMFK